MAYQMLGKFNRCVLFQLPIVVWVGTCVSIFLEPNWVRSLPGFFFFPDHLLYFCLSIACVPFVVLSVFYLLVMWPSSIGFTIVAKFILRLLLVVLVMLVTITQIYSIYYALVYGSV